MGAIGPEIPPQGAPPNHGSNATTTSPGEPNGTLGSERQTPPADWETPRTDPARWRRNRGDTAQPPTTPLPRGEPTISLLTGHDLPSVTGSGSERDRRRSGRITGGKLPRGTSLQRIASGSGRKQEQTSQGSNNFSTHKVKHKRSEEASLLTTLGLRPTSVTGLVYTQGRIARGSLRK